MKILQFLGYSKVVLRCDAEPVLMKVQSLLQTARQKLSLETWLENGRVRDPGINAWVENAVNRVRQQAMTLIYHLELQLRMSFPVTHPLFSWCFVHACWLLNRFLPSGAHLLRQCVDVSMMAGSLVLLNQFWHLLVQNLDKKDQPSG